jgi:predicted kinase
VERAVPVVSGISGVGKTTVATHLGPDPEESAAEILRRAWTEGRVS